METEILAALDATVESELRCLEANDMTALRVLAAEEARLMDALRAIWHADD